MDELLALRLSLLAVIFVFILFAAILMMGGLRTRAVRGRASGAAAGPRLVVLGPAGSGLPVGHAFPLAAAMTIGRDDTNGIVLPDPSVSGRHASIERTGSGWRVTDLGSTNGTYVNGTQIDGRGAGLRGGERVALGSVALRFTP